MKNLLCLSFLLINFTMLFGQKPLSNSSESCENFNSYLNSDQLELLKYFTTDIKPTGLLTFDGTVMDELDGVEDLFPLLGIDNQTGFELIDIYQSRLNENHIYSKFQQTYKGIPVEGGGFTTVTYGEFHTGGDPCDKLIALSTYLVDQISVNTTPSISKKALDELLILRAGFDGNDGLNLNSELIISSIGRNDCEFGLTWKSNYANKGNELSYVDAHSGDILNEQDQMMELTAPTEIFGDVDLSDTEVNTSQRKLMCSHGTTLIKTHDFKSAPLFLPPFTYHEFPDYLIPITYQAMWTDQEAHKSVYQAHYVVNRCLPAYESLGINFTDLNIGANFDGLGAFVKFNPGFMNGNIHFGAKNGFSFALHDVAAHELAHIYISKFILGNTLNKASIHEAYSDILGTYAEYKVKGGPNWWMGDEVEGIKSAINRNLASPEYSCMSIFNLNPDAFWPPHRRSQPLSHWFYLLSQGFSQYGNSYDGVGIDVATDIALEILYMIGPEADYLEIKEVASQLLYEHYGVCSTAMTTASAAFNKICMGYFDYPVSPCFFTVSAQDYRCEEWDNSYNLCIENAQSGLDYRWTIMDSQGVYWTSSNGTQSGNSFITGPTQPCLYIDHIPEYNSYPREIKISVYPIEYGPGYKQIKRLTLLDCDGSTPDPCDGNFLIEKPKVDETSLRAYGEQNDIYSIKVFDLMGRMWYSGSEDNLDLQQISVNGLIIISYFNQQGEFLNSVKQFISN